MNRESLRKLRLDRRLIDRKGWISDSELEKELGALPDTSDKRMPPEEDDDEQPAASDGEKD